jgi:hypothetical protein
MKDPSPFALYPSLFTLIGDSVFIRLNPESCLYAKLILEGSGGSRGNATRARCQVGCAKSTLSFAGVPAAIGMWVHDKWPLTIHH